LLIALLPLVALLAIRWSGIFRLEANTLDKATLVAVAWALVSIIVPLDPSVATKIEAVRRSTNLLGGEKPKASSK
jgi:hypothetical protein